MTLRLATSCCSLTLSAALFTGCSRGSAPDAPVAETPVPAAPAAQAAPVPAAPETPAAQPAPAQSGSHVGERTKEILDAREQVKDPNWTVVASDPTQVKGYSIAGTAYNRAAALAGTADLEKWVQLEQAQSESGKFPTYAALMQYVGMNSVTMPHLREYQHYGYDETTGQIVILENAAEKDARRRELGLSPNE